MATAEASSVATPSRIRKARQTSSNTNIAPPVGALKATPRPAPAAAVRRSTWSRGGRRRQAGDLGVRATAPIWTLGPSRPRARPEPMARTPPTNFTGTVRETGRLRLAPGHGLHVLDAAARRERREADEGPRDPGGRGGAEHRHEPPQGRPLVRPRQERVAGRSGRVQGEAEEGSEDPGEGAGEHRRRGQHRQAVRLLEWLARFHGDWGQLRVRATGFRWGRARKVRRAT